MAGGPRVQCIYTLNAVESWVVARATHQGDSAGSIGAAAAEVVVCGLVGILVHDQE